MDKNVELGVALSGGGLQGFSHIGALRALEELGGEIGYISGTSTGSIIASFYAMGLDTYEMEEICRLKYKNIIKIKKKVILKAIMNYLIMKETRTGGLIDGRIIEKFINDEAIKKNINSISDVSGRKLAIATVDTKSIKECIFISDEVEWKNENINYIRNINIGKAVRASMAFPGIFDTVNFEKYNFIDGGTVDNLPTKVLRDMGADKIISVGLDTSHYDVTNNLENVILRALDVYSYSDVKDAEKIADIAVEIYNSDTGLLEMKEMQKTVENGYNAIMNKKEEILDLLEMDMLENLIKIG